MWGDSTHILILVIGMDFVEASEFLLDKGECDWNSLAYPETAIKDLPHSFYRRLVSGMLIDYDYQEGDMYIAQALQNIDSDTIIALVDCHV